MEVLVKMIDITSKPVAYREAVASGRIYLRRETIEKIKRGEVEKGDVISATQLVAIMACKKTPEILPLCHPIPITGVDVSLDIQDNYIELRVRVRTTAKTGVEMEALTATLVGLLNIWDMVKKYEKDEKGQYPYTRISDVRVESKIKVERSSDT